MTELMEPPMLDANAAAGSDDIFSCRGFFSTENQRTSHNARALVKKVLANLPAEHPQEWEIDQVVGELIGNAVRHGLRNSKILLQVELTAEGWARILVGNLRIGRSRPVIRQWDENNPERLENARGLAMVKAMADSLDWSVSSSSTRVWATFSGQRDAAEPLP